MSLKVIVSIDTVAALRRGASTAELDKRTASIEIPDGLPAEDRNLIADHMDNRGRGTEDRYFMVWSRGSMLTLALGEPTLAELLKVLREHREKDRAIEAEREAKAAARLDDLTDMIVNRRESSDKQRVWPNFEWERRTPEKMLWDSDREKLDEAVVAEYDRWVQQMNDDNAMRQAAAEADRDGAAAAAEAEEAEREAVMDGWIDKHGSKHLKRLRKEGYDYADEYADERLKADRPGWNFQRDYERKAFGPPIPNPRAFELLDAARSGKWDSPKNHWILDSFPYLKGKNCEPVPEAKLVFMRTLRVNDRDGEDEDIPCYCWFASAEFLGRTILTHAEDWIEDVED
jgi:hypothetical protein